MTDRSSPLPCEISYTSTTTTTSILNPTQPVRPSVHLLLPVQSSVRLLFRCPYPSIHPSVNRAPILVHLSICQSSSHIHLHLPIHQSTNPPINQSSSPPVHESTNPRIHQPTNLPTKTEHLPINQSRSSFSIAAQSFTSPHLTSPYLYHSRLAMRCARCADDPDSWGRICG